MIFSPHLCDKLYIPTYSYSIFFDYFSFVYKSSRNIGKKCSSHECKYQKRVYFFALSQHFQWNRFFMPIDSHNNRNRFCIPLAFICDLAAAFKIKNNRVNKKKVLYLWSLSWTCLFPCNFCSKDLTEWNGTGIRSASMNHDSLYKHYKVLVLFFFMYYFWKCCFLCLKMSLGLCVVRFLLKSLDGKTFGSKLFFFRVWFGTSKSKTNVQTTIKKTKSDLLHTICDINLSRTIFLFVFSTKMDNIFFLPLKLSYYFQHTLF